MGIATALDTCGGGNLFAAKGLLYLTDLVVLDLTPVEPGALDGRPSPSSVGTLRFAGMLRAQGLADVSIDPEGNVLAVRKGTGNGEMVAIDGGMHLRTSGVDDLLGWSEAHWEQLRRARIGR